MIVSMLELVLCCSSRIALTYCAARSVGASASVRFRDLPVGCYLRRSPGKVPTRERMFIAVIPNAMHVMCTVTLPVLAC